MIGFLECDLELRKIEGRWLPVECRKIYQGPVALHDRGYEIVTPVHPWQP